MTPPAKGEYLNPALIPADAVEDCPMIASLVSVSQARPYLPVLSADRHKVHFKDTSIDSYTSS